MVTSPRHPLLRFRRSGTVDLSDGLLHRARPGWGLSLLPLLALPLLGIGQCGAAGSLEPGFEQDLTQVGGCADITLYAQNEEDTLAMVVRTATAYAEQAHAAGGPITVSWSLPDPDLDLKVELGRYLTQIVCNDVVSESPQVDDTYLPSSGMATLTVTPEGDVEPWETPARATLVLENLVLESQEVPGSTVPLELFTFDDIYVGWMPG